MFALRLAVAGALVLLDLAVLALVVTALVIGQDALYWWAGGAGCVLVAISIYAGPAIFDVRRTR